VVLKLELALLYRRESEEIPCRSPKERAKYTRKNEAGRPAGGLPQSAVPARTDFLLDRRIAPSISRGNWKMGGEIDDVFRRLLRRPGADRSEGDI
jgi:hypothetical protein